MQCADDRSVGRMFLRAIPRFKPSLSVDELFTVFRQAFDKNAFSDTTVSYFEREFAAYIGATEAIAVPSARMGLYLALSALGFQQGDEVILPSLTFFSIPAMLVHMGLVPVFVDIDPTTYLIDLSEAEARITSRTRAIIPTHLYGLPVDMRRVGEIAKKHNLVVIEDCAQSCGAEFEGRKTGSFGDIGYFTFGVTKNFTTIGGGMLTCRDPVVAERIRGRMRDFVPFARSFVLKNAVVGAAMKVATNRFFFGAFLWPALRLLRLVGKDPIEEGFREPVEPISQIPSRYRKRLTGVQADVGVSELKRIDHLCDLRHRNGKYLIERLEGTNDLVVPRIPEGSRHIFTSFVVQTSDRDYLARELLRRGVDTAKGYMSACSSLPIFKDYYTECPNATTAVKNMLHLPVYHTLGVKELEHIATSVRQIMNVG